MTEIDRAPVWPNLRYQWNFRGLTLVHLIIPLSAAVIVLTLCVVTGISVVYAFGVFLAVLAAIAIVQYRRPDTYLEDLVTQLCTPLHLNHAIEDQETWEFPVGPEELRRR